MKASELKEHLVRLQEINITLATLYAERATVSARLFTDPDTGPILVAGGEVETEDGYKVLGQKMDPDKVSPWERQNGMKAPTGHIIKLKMTIPKGGA